ncbi:AhpD-like protein [Trichoderma asperelloides]|nr:AhpD-like protein [Trichoderma asperelloides]
MRLPYVPNPPVDLDAAGRAVLSEILARRGGSGLISLDRALLHSPIIAGGWHSFFGAIYSGSILLHDLLELAVCRVALLNRAWYQYDGHVRALARCEGFDSAKLKIVETLQPSDRGPLSLQQWAVLRYADAMTKDIAVHDTLTLTIAAYNGVSRFLVALDIGEMNLKPTAIEATDPSNSSSS